MFCHSGAYPPVYVLSPFQGYWKNVPLSVPGACTPVCILLSLRDYTSVYILVSFQDYDPCLYQDFLTAQLPALGEGLGGAFTTTHSPDTT